MGQTNGTLKPKAVEDLMRMTDFNDKELNQWYQEFQKDAPKGHLSKSEFVKMFRNLFPESDPSQFADHVFRTFDVNKDGVLNFREFIIGLSLTLKGTFDEKLFWAFKIYDVDGNGFISQSELNEIIAAMLALCRTKFPAMLAEELILTLDKNNDGQVSWAEFRKGVNENKSLTKLLKEALDCVTPA
ncbi:hippocalcin-like protein 1 [Clavelina lepadiformis]|uniref:hippocalcin-like protein 1 n=1 Tax=Clavelina lepadiformis TaxID=159417 RepID=UPI0040420CA6